MNSVDLENKIPVIAAIDIGTNSIHLAIASINYRGMLSIISRDKDMVRLGSSGTDMKYLSDEAIDRGVKTLTHFANLAKSEKALIRAVATSAVREAHNKNVFIERAFAEAGIQVEIISGIEEGRLIYIGAMHALPIYPNKALVIDIGGGSTETVIGQKGEILHANSEKLGAIRLTKRFFENGGTNKETIKECREYIKGEWSPEMRCIEDVGFETVVGCAGTIESLAQMVLAARGEAAPDVLNGITVPTDEMLKVIESIAKADSMKSRNNLPGMDTSRSDIILAGALILESFLKKLSIKKILISPYALREGIVFDTLQKVREIKEFNHLSHLRYETVLNLCNKFRIDVKHAMHVKDISLFIFDALKPLHKLGNVERELLEAGALLHDVGYIVSHDQHHNHSYYIITHSDMPGFTNDEAELIGNLARYHRKSHPKKKHSEFITLPQSKQEIVKILSGILRLGEGIDRRRKQYVKDINIEVKGNVVHIKLNPASQDTPPDIEIWGAQRRTPLLEESLSVEIQIE